MRATGPTWSSPARTSAWSCLGRRPRISVDEAGGLRAALENLCYDALSFTPEGGVISLSLRREGGQAVIEVKDNGAGGIAPEDLPRVFDRGFTRREDGSGEGLGLYIVRTFAIEHGGSVEAAPAPGGGAVFTIRLPLLC